MDINNKLCGVQLNVIAPEALSQFYVECLGMEVHPMGDAWRLSYPHQDSYLSITRAEQAVPYAAGRLDEYWKIGITVPNLDRAYAQLTGKGIPVSAPKQFKDIGYLAHVTDPEGFHIELLQHTFKGEPLTEKGVPQKPLHKPLGGSATLAHITLRTTDIEADLAYYQQECGMSLLSVQPVSEYGFTLYFLAHTDEQPPNPDLEAVENRPWLWQRPYTMLELQHLTLDGHQIKKTEAGSCGYAGLVFES